MAPNFSQGSVKMIYRKRNLDLIGQKFGYLTVIEKAEPDKHGHPMWRCECECGKESTVLQSHLLSGHTLSCGCYSKRITSEMSKRVNKRYNEYDLTGPYGIGYTLKGEPFLFDIEDYDCKRDICWFKNRRGYIIGKLNRKKHISIEVGYELCGYYGCRSYRRHKYSTRQ
jgi:hypothetical protein